MRGGEKLYSVHFCPFDPVCTEELQPVNSIVQPSCPLPPGTMINEPIYSTERREDRHRKVLTEMRARIDSARMKPVLKDEAEALAKWLHENHSGAPSMTVRTIENAIRDLHHRAKPQKEKQYRILWPFIVARSLYTLSARAGIRTRLRAHPRTLRDQNAERYRSPNAATRHNSRSSRKWKSYSRRSLRARRPQPNRPL
jgi:hypothetical protein